MRLFSRSWVRHMSSLPLAKPELRPSLAPHHAPSRSQDDSGEWSAHARSNASRFGFPVLHDRFAVLAGINVSRNPSDASEKSLSSAAPDDEASSERASDKERASSDRDDDKRRDKSAEREDERRSVDKEEHEKEEKHK